ncbi:Carboxypeptidase G2 precursor [Pragia fontium]|uniref:M20 family metallopeptidase n=1 Tax=Pragia fontium TaxID=82985 RepID=UPI000DFA8591|nr:M20 family metallopeptidase [Pragia fontium]SUB83244.1 Carboxypeptidase G2 precursor [Pragia fontium]
MSAILSYLSQHQNSILSDLEQLANAESPSHNKNAVDACGQVLQKLFMAHLGVTAETFPQTQYGNHLAFHIGNGSQKILILGHFDTVWDIGRLTLRQEDGKLFGPGVLDMKGGLIQAIWAVKALKKLNQLGDRQIDFLCNADEELGSPSSRAIIEQQAPNYQQVLVVEPATAGNGALKTGRKGTGRFYVHIKGKAAHAGNNPEDGISAIQEMSYQIQYLHSLNAPHNGTTVNVGVASGGSVINVVAEEANLCIDVRVTRLDEAERIHHAIYGSVAKLDGIQLTVTGGMVRPPMERNQASGKLFAKAQEAAKALGFDISEASVGGGSDGNFTAALGIPTLDGLGSTGAGPHAEYEHIIIDDLAKRSALLAELIVRL